MLLAIGIKIALLSAALLGLLVPIRSRSTYGGLDDRGSDLEYNLGYYAGHRAIGLIRPVAHLLDRLATAASIESGRSPWSVSLGSSLAVLAPLLAWSVIPFGGHYQVGSWRIDLVIAKLEAGMLWLFVAGLLSLLAGLLIDRSDEGRVRAAVMGVSQIAGMSLALIGVLIVFGSLDLVEIVSAQDRTLDLLPLIANAGLGMGWLDVPAWGVVYQPVAFLVYLVCGSLALRPAPLCPIRSARDGGASGASIQLLRLGGHLDALVLAGVATALFLGGGAIPYLPAERIVRSIADFYGTGLATWLCMAIHLAVFLTKVALLTSVQAPLAEFLRTTRLATSLGLLWKVIIPVAFLNVLLTASIEIAGRTG